MLSLEWRYPRLGERLKSIALGLVCGEQTSRVREFISRSFCYCTLWFVQLDLWQSILRSQLTAGRVSFGFFNLIVAIYIEHDI